MQFLSLTLNYLLYCLGNMTNNPRDRDNDLSDPTDDEDTLASRVRSELADHEGEQTTDPGKAWKASLGNN